MAADFYEPDDELEDLLERADRAERAALPTRQELVRELEEAIARLERSRRGSFDHSMASLKIDNARWRLRHEEYREDEPGSEEPAVKHPEEWQAFINSHPELTEPPKFSDDELLAALRTAIDSQERPWLQGAASSSCVVSVLRHHAGVVENGKATRITIHVGKQLARLSRERRVVRLRRKWTKGRGGSIWSLPDVEIADWWLKQFEVETAQADMSR